MMKKRKSNFRDQVVSDAREAKSRGSKYGYINLPKGVRMLSLKEGVREILLDFIPYEVTDSKHPDRNETLGRAMEGELWYKRPFKVHKNVGADNNTAVCLKSNGKKCPVCEYIEEKLKKGADWDEVVALAAKDRNLYTVIPIDSSDHEEEIYIWDMSQHLFQNELNDNLSENEENGIFPDLEEGKTMEVKLKWKKFGKYLFPETRDVDFVDRDAYDESILDDTPNLDEVLNILSYKELYNLFLEIDEDDEAGEYEEADENAQPESSKPKRTLRKKKDPEPEQENEPEEERKLARRKPTRKKDDDEAEPERKPTRKESSNEDEDQCPHGHRFGIDTEKKDECDSCDLWNDCLDAKESK